MIGKYLILEKISDDFSKRFGLMSEGVGNTKIQGYLQDKIEIGEQIFLYINQNSKVGSYPICWTSKVKSFDEENMIIKTKNSTYKIIIDENREI